MKQLNSETHQGLLSLMDQVHKEGAEDLASLTPSTPLYQLRAKPNRCFTLRADGVDAPPLIADLAFLGGDQINRVLALTSTGAFTGEPPGWRADFYIQIEFGRPKDGDELAAGPLKLLQWFDPERSEGHVGLVRILTPHEGVQIAGKSGISFPISRRHVTASLTVDSQRAHVGFTHTGELGTQLEYRKISEDIKMQILRLLQAGENSLQ